MNTDQLYEILSYDRYIKPDLITVCPIDHLEHYISHAASQPQRRTAAIVFNLDPSHLPGSHWVLMYLDFNGHAEYFDSTSRPPDLFCKDLMRRYCPKSILYNRIVLQDDTMVCGQFCVAFLLFRCRGYTFHQVINQLNSPSNDVDVYELIRPYFPHLPYHVLK